MDALTIFGALNVTEGSAAIGVLTPAELPPGNLSWTAREITSADQAFAAPPAVAAAPSDPSLVNTWLLTSAAFLAWKEATFLPAGRQDEHRKKDDDQDKSS